MSGALPVESCIEMFRTALARLGIPERDVKVTWDNEHGWARARLRLPSGAIVDRTSREQCPPATKDPRRVAEHNLTVLARWMKATAKTNPTDLDGAFAEHLVPKETP